MEDDDGTIQMMDTFVAHKPEVDFVEDGIVDVGDALLVDLVAIAVAEIADLAAILVV